MTEKPATFAVETGEAIARGEAPSTYQVTGMLRETKEALKEREEEIPLDLRGMTLAQDANKVLESAARLIEEKNADELAQQLYKHGKEASEEAAVKAERAKKYFVGVPPLARAETENIVNSARVLSVELIRSQEFRVLLLDTLDLLQRIFKTRIEQETAELKEAVKSDVEKQKEEEHPPESAKEALPETTEKLKEKGEELKKELTTEEPTRYSLTKEEREELSNKFRGILAKLGENENYHRAVNSLFNLYDQFRVRLDLLAKDPALKIVPGDPVQLAWQDSKKLVDRFAREGDTDRWISCVRELIDDVRQDEEASRFFTDLRNFISKSLKNPELLQSEHVKKEFDDLIDRASDLMNKRRYRDQFNSIMNETQILINDIKEDEAAKEFANAVAKFARDLLVDTTGRPTLGALQDSLVKMKELFVPVILKELQHIPVARIEGCTDKYDYILDNITISGTDILPEHVRLYMESDVDIKMQEVGRDVLYARLYLEIAKMRPHIKDINFAYRRKVTPQMEDIGVADIIFGGNGMTLRNEWVVHTRPNKPMKFYLRNAECKIDQLNIRVKQAENHPILDRLAAKLFSGTFRHQLEDTITDELKRLGIIMSNSLNDALRQLPQVPLAPKSF